MFEHFNNVLAGYLDYVLGWMLFLPRDLMLIMLAVLTSAILTFVRVFTTDQKWLGQADADRIRLNELIAEAKQRYKNALASAKDDAARRIAKTQFKEDRARYKNTQAQIKMKASTSEILPLAVSLIPIALLATWAFPRVDYVPPRINQPIEIRMIVPTSAIGKLAYIEPQADIQEADSAWVQRVAVEPAPEAQGWWDNAAKSIRAFGRGVYNKLTSPFPKTFQPMVEAKPIPRGAAIWHINASEPGNYKIDIHYQNQTFTKGVLIGQRQYGEQSLKFTTGPVQAINIVLAEQRLFGFVGGIDMLFLAPWLVAYLIVAIPFVTVLKRVFRIY